MLPKMPRHTPMVVVPILLVLITFLFWYQTWFGRTLSDPEMQAYLAASAHPHKIQHALAQLSDRMARGDRTTARWYPQLLALADSPNAELRLETAWVMGQDNQSEAFHQALRKLLNDQAPLVRWNAALALARFHDSAARPQLRAMLEPFTLTAPGAGVLEFRAKEGDTTRRGAVVARLDAGEGEKKLELRTPLDGRVVKLLAPEGARVASGQELVVMEPAESQVIQALAAFGLVGGPEDIAAVKRFCRPDSGASPGERRQAEAALNALRERAGH